MLPLPVFSLIGDFFFKASVVKMSSNVMQLNKDDFLKGITYELLLPVVDSNRSNLGCLVLGEEWETGEKVSVNWRTDR